MGEMLPECGNCGDVLLASDIAVGEAMDNLLIQIDDDDDKSDETVPMACLMAVSSHYASEN